MNDATFESIRQKLARGAIVRSMTVRLVRGVEIAAIARGAGYDALYIDLQHSGISVETAGQISIAAHSMGVAPFVRVPGVDAAAITSALDAGATGVIVPDIHSAAAAAAVVRAAKYRPIGERSLPGVMSQLAYRAMPATRATVELNDLVTVVVMIESSAGLHAVEKIAAVDGVDVLLVGANDLCTEAGVPGQFEHPLVEEAYRRTLDACRAYGRTLGVGGLASRPDLMRRYIDMGGRYVSLGADLSMLAAAARQKIDDLG